jgi:glucose-6-phosphate isomerase
MGTLRRLNPERTLVNVVSKSGGTVETLAGYLITREWLESHLGEEEARNRLVFTTDPETGFLHDIAGKEGITTFPIPTNVGGRFSVLSAVGLLPASFAGIDTGTLLKGARTMREHCTKVDPTQNPAAITAGIHFLMDTALGRHNTVFWVYADALRSTADWFAQLWGESLGKTKGRKRIGPTPIPAVGATDQHSQLQLYMDGPDNKGIWFVEVGKFGEEGSIPSLHPDAPETAYLGGLSLESLLHAERRATALALGQAGKPNGTIHLRDCSAECLGALLFFLQMQTAITGELYEIDPYDQPGVEAGKIFTYGLMNREGFDAQKGQLEEAEDQHIPHVIAVEVDDNASSG